jgi:hypothetical protein
LARRTLRPLAQQRIHRWPPASGRASANEVTGAMLRRRCSTRGSPPAPRGSATTRANLEGTGHVVLPLPRLRDFGNSRSSENGCPAMRSVQPCPRANTSVTSAPSPLHGARRKG